MEFRGLAEIPNTPIKIVPPSPYGGSIQFDGYGAPVNKGSRFDLTNSSEYAFGTGDFTIEFYYKWLMDPATLPNTPSTISIGAFSDGYTWSVKMGYFWYMNVQTAPNVSGTILMDNTIASSGVWYHAAFTRESGVVKAWNNGTQTNKTFNNTSDVTYDSAKRFSVGRERRNSGTILSAVVPYWRMTNIRIVKGTALYTNTFTPSQYPLTAVSNTKLLMLVNSSGDLLTDSSSVGNNGTQGTGGQTVSWSDDTPFPFTI